MQEIKLIAYKININNKWSPRDNIINTNTNTITNTITTNIISINIITITNITTTTTIIIITITSITKKFAIIREIKKLKKFVRL